MIYNDQISVFDPFVNYLHIVCHLFVHSLWSL